MEVLPSSNIKEKIYNLRNLEVMLDSDLAELYSVETKRINEAITDFVSIPQAHFFEYFI